MWVKFSNWKGSDVVSDPYRFYELLGEIVCGELATRSFEIVDAGRQLAVSVDGYVGVEMDLEVIPRPLSHYPEVVHVGALDSGMDIEAALCHAVSVVLFPFEESAASELLWIPVTLHRESIVVCRYVEETVNLSM